MKAKLSYKKPLKIPPIDNFGTVMLESAMQVYKPKDLLEIRRDFFLP